MNLQKTVYVAMSADLVHHGHANVLKAASEAGDRVVVGLLTDKAIAGYKRTTIMKWEERRLVVSSLRYVDEVVPQETLDYRPNLERIRPDVVVHGSDWREGPQKETRRQVIDTLERWGGRLVEPEYTEGVSTSLLIRRQAAKAPFFPIEPLSPLSPLASLEPLARLDLDRMAVAPVEPPERRPVAYVAVSSEVLHHGTVRVIGAAAKLGRVVVGVPACADFVAMERMFLAVRGVDEVVPHVPGYTNMRAIRPAFVVHGNDWIKDGRLADRDYVIRQLAEWEGRLVETEAVSFREIEEKMQSDCLASE